MCWQLQRHGISERSHLTGTSCRHLHRSWQPRTAEQTPSDRPPSAGHRRHAAPAASDLQIAGSVSSQQQCGPGCLASNESTCSSGGGAAREHAGAGNASELPIS